MMLKIPSIYLGTNPRAEASQYFRFVIGCFCATVNWSPSTAPSRLKSFQPRTAINCMYEAAVMKRRCGYKGYVIEAQSHELQEGGLSTKFFIEEHDAIGAMETRYEWD